MVEQHNGSNDFGTQKLEEAFELTERFKWKKLLGAGGMGRAHLVSDSWTGEDIVLKQILPQHLNDLSILNSFLREATMARRLAHPNIIRIHDLHYFRFRWYHQGQTGHLEEVFEPSSYNLTMDYVQGKDLKEYQKERCARICGSSSQGGEKKGCQKHCFLPLEVVQKIALDLCSALSYAHSRNIMHRDIKPANIFCRTNSGGRILESLLADFGLARELPSDSNPATQQGIRGSLLYMPPEQLGILDTNLSGPRLDIFALGITLYKLLTGRHPYLSGDGATQASYHNLLANLVPRYDRILKGQAGKADQPMSITQARKPYNLGAKEQLTAQIEKAILACISIPIDSRPSSAEELREILSLPWTKASEQKTAHLQALLQQGWRDIKKGKIAEAEKAISQAKQGSSTVSLPKDVAEVLDVMKCYQAKKRKNLALILSIFVLFSLLAGVGLGVWASQQEHQPTKNQPTDSRPYVPPVERDTKMPVPR